MVLRGRWCDITVPNAHDPTVDKNVHPKEFLYTIDNVSKMRDPFYMVAIIRILGSIHSAVCLTTGPKPVPKPALHTVRSRASTFK